MRWIEFIHVRAFSEEFRARALKEAKALSMKDAPEMLESIGLWDRSDLPTDLSILLRWTEKPVPGASSSIGLQLAENFSRFGWVNHSVWADMVMIQKEGGK
ncbi:MAG: hypothetical protein C4519_08015 [Desulfobacteraceae bacterium]|nr:MAG: hypothetical protein C4519_08015 [Desulfobacteraceae bacterium]